ncbi:IS5-like element ISLpl3 family transposase, partial [Lactiplantibacillus plantarum]|nr:IS5-like element ISLpl3 family transposase [Lactiplantibacillus plantarum]MDL2063871.1 IS5-like element ISLpl3 family transposase [Lactiplantibacillus paraplantarum]MCI3956718.1 IS5-like element ISLpl3 family transposase [Lactiplantibacillus plantarum]MCK3678209.1 IS5-like element ISLpl3 family transposase [Lactiplantibacillus plantarum]MCT3259857.1 IS5-like element ISLpl3 family transposase [Lactiplantibacillus plantarum]
MTTPKRYELEDAQWDRIKGYFPPYRTGRPSSLDNRTALNAILWLMRSGAPWRDLPERYGSWKTVYSRFRAWVSSGLFEQVFLELIDDPDMENLSLDSTIVRAHQKATGAKK